MGVSWMYRRLLVGGIIAFVFLISCVLLLTSKPNSLNLEITPSNQSVPFLIIISEARSGSTWLESFFKENERVLDFFEPLDQRAFSNVLKEGQTLSDEQYTRIKLDILSNECQCQFKHVAYPSMGERASWSKSLHRLQGYLDKNGEVIPEFRKPKSMDLKASLKAATPEDLTKVEEMCRGRELVSAKVIRLRDISLLSHLPKLGCIDFKVLHLIRDPRPIIQSRMITFGELHQGNGEKKSEFDESDIKAVAADICQTYLHNVRVGLSPQFKDVYRIVKYEDIGSAPVEYAREVYNYVGMTLTPDIEEYIRKSSSGSTVVGKYEVVRNTAEVIDNWKNTMNPDHAKVVESQCLDMLKTFGYEFI